MTALYATRQLPPGTVSGPAWPAPQPPILTTLLSLPSLLSLLSLPSTGQSGLGGTGKGGEGGLSDYHGPPASPRQVPLVSEQNCHPFRFGRWSFMCAGSLLCSTVHTTYSTTFYPALLQPTSDPIQPQPTQPHDTTRHRTAPHRTGRFRSPGITACCLLSKKKVTPHHTILCPRHKGMVPA